MVLVQKSAESKELKEGAVGDRWIEESAVVLSMDRLQRRNGPCAGHLLME